MDIFARIYDTLLTPLNRMGLKRLRRELVASTRGRVLEMGVGTGLNLEYYPLGVEITGVDPDTAMLAKAAARSRGQENVTLLEGRAESLPFPDSHFDDVVFSLVLCTVESPRAVLREVRRVLRPGGRVFLLEHVRAPQRTLAALQDLLTPAWKRLAGGCRLNRDTAQTLAWEGFRVVRTKKYAGGSLLLMEAQPR